MKQIQDNYYGVIQNNVTQDAFCAICVSIIKLWRAMGFAGQAEPGTTIFMFSVLSYLAAFSSGHEMFFNIDSELHHEEQHGQTASDDKPLSCFRIRTDSTGTLCTMLLVGEVGEGEAACDANGIDEVADSFIQFFSDCWLWVYASSQLRVLIETTSKWF